MTNKMVCDHCKKPLISGWSGIKILRTNRSFFDRIHNACIGPYIEQYGEDTGPVFMIGLVEKTRKEDGT